MKKRSIIIATIFTLLFIIGGLASCRHGRHAGSFDEFDLAAATDRIASRLDLTESQKENLNQIAQEIVDKAKTMHGGDEDRHQELATLVRQETIDPDMVDQIIANKMERMKTLVGFAAERLITFHETLTPDQREKIASHIEDRADKHCRFGFN